MDAQSKFIARNGLKDWLTELSARFEVWTPRAQGPGGHSAVTFQVFDPSVPPELDRKPTESAKRTIFPRSEALFRFDKTPDPARPGQNALRLSMPNAPSPRLVFGLPPCDARSFLTFDPVYSGVGGKAEDPYYLRRRAQTVLIARACSRTLTTCFCHWVGGDPASTEGVDVLATETKEGFLLAPLSETGAAVLDSKLLSVANEGIVAEAAAVQAGARQSLHPAPDLSGAEAALRGRFEDASFWQAEAAHCLSCGVCTFLCPTCYCFNMTDESAGMKGVRLRSWDACMLPLFTQEASGHNPRPDKAARLKNRVGHKFSYYPALHDARIACVGCGRCIKSCPSGVDIRRIVTDALGKTQAPGPKRRQEAPKE
jgi:ferredoxin